MNVVEPIRNVNDVQLFKNYFLEQRQYRNYLLVTIGLNTALRICDILNLKWCDLYDFQKKCTKKHINVTEKKTGKNQSIFVNAEIVKAIKHYLENVEIESVYVFAGPTGKPISRVQVHRLLVDASDYLGINHVSCHSLRKTFGYHAWKTGANPALLMTIFNHSDFEVTKRYLGIAQDDKDKLFESVCL